MKHLFPFKSLVVGLTASLFTTAGAGENRFGPPQGLDVPGCTELEGPEVIDYDGDGVRDLLSGLYSGHLLLRRNLGTNKVPRYAEPVKLQSGGKDIKLKHW